jgi:hypothetical protein
MHQAAGSSKQFVEREDAAGNAKNEDHQKVGK